MSSLTVYSLDYIMSFKKGSETKYNLKKHVKLNDREHIVKECCNLLNKASFDNKGIIGKSIIDLNNKFPDYFYIIIDCISRKLMEDDTFFDVYYEIIKELDTVLVDKFYNKIKFCNEIVFKKVVVLLMCDKYIDKDWQDIYNSEEGNIENQLIILDSICNRNIDISSFLEKLNKNKFDLDIKHQFFIEKIIEKSANKSQVYIVEKPNNNIEKEKNLINNYIDEYLMDEEYEDFEKAVEKFQLDIVVDKVLEKLLITNDMCLIMLLQQMSTSMSIDGILKIKMNELVKKKEQLEIDYPHVSNIVSCIKKDFEQILTTPPQITPFESTSST